MMRGRGERVALVYRGDQNSRRSQVMTNGRLVPVAKALAEAGFAPEPAVYNDAWAGQFRDHLLGVRAALVWVDPVADGQDRTGLDAILREVAGVGVWVTAHPDTIVKMGTKEVLFQTRHGRGRPPSPARPDLAGALTTHPRSSPPGGTGTAKAGAPQKAARSVSWLPFISIHRVRRGPAAASAHAQTASRHGVPDGPVVSAVAMLPASRSRIYDDVTSA